MKVTEMRVGQIWENNDHRDHIRLKRVVRVDGGRAYIAPVDGGRMVQVDCEKFLKRQGTRSGYTLLRGSDE